MFNSHKNQEDYDQLPEYLKGYVDGVADMLESLTEFFKEHGGDYRNWLETKNPYIKMGQVRLDEIHNQEVNKT